MNEPESAPPEHGAPAGNWPVALLTALLAAQLGLAWIQGRMLNRQHAQLLDIREDILGLAEAIESSYGDAPQEEGNLAPAAAPSALDRHRKGHRKHLRKPRLASYRIQEPQTEPPPEQDPAAKEIQAAKDSMEKAAKEGKIVQKKLSIREAAERANRVEKVDNASKGFMWASIGTAVVLFGAFAARGFIRRQRG